MKKSPAESKIPTARNNPAVPTAPAATMDKGFSKPRSRELAPQSPADKKILDNPNPQKGDGKQKLVEGHQYPDTATK